jgi:hypothetical protein
MFIIILNNSIDSFNGYDFTILDPECKSYKTHPLMLLARSGQETLLTHETTQKLLSLKWRTIPRILFYSNLIFYLIYLIFFGLFSIELTELNFANAEFESSIDEIWKTNFISVYFYPLFIIWLLNIAKFLLENALKHGI